MKSLKALKVKYAVLLAIGATMAYFGTFGLQGIPFNITGNGTIVVHTWTYDSPSNSWQSLGFVNVSVFNLTLTQSRVFWKTITTNQDGVTSTSEDTAFAPGTYEFNATHNGVSYATVISCGTEYLVANLRLGVAPPPPFDWLLFVRELFVNAQFRAGLALAGMGLAASASILLVTSARLPTKRRREI